MCKKGDSPALNAGQVFELVQSTSLQRQPPPVFTYKNYENHVEFHISLLSRFAQVKSCAEAVTDIRIMEKYDDFVIFRKPAIVRMFSFSLK